VLLTFVSCMLVGFSWIWILVLFISSYGEVLEIVELVAMAMVAPWWIGQWKKMYIAMVEQIIDVGCLLFKVGFEGRCR
jgi:hypothetical protein